MFAYQINRYWQNQMYIQNVQKPNRSLPRSSTYESRTTPLSGPFRSHSTSRIIMARPLVNSPLKLYTAKIVLYQSGSSDMIQSVVASQNVNAKTTRIGRASCRERG